MKDKVNPHGLRVGVIRNWESRWNPVFSQQVCISRINENIRNLNITSNVRIFGYKSCDIERIVKTMKQR